MRYHYLFSLVVTLLVATNTSAQQMSIRHDTLIWRTNYITLPEYDSVISYSGEWITGIPDKIIWKQNAGKHTTEFTVTSIDGGWENPLLRGNLMYHVMILDKSGSIQFVRENQNVSIKMTFIENGVSNYPWTYNVNKIDKQ